MKRLACVVALATGTGLAMGAGVAPATAAPMPAAPSDIQLTVANPGTLSGDSLLLDVAFKGGNLRSIELHMDGFLVKRQQVRTQGGRGVITIALDGVSEGEHDILIKAIDVKGNVSTATSRVKIAPAEDAGAAQIMTPKPETAVQGTVPIQIKMDESIRNPYVVFLLNNDFKAFVNLAPFTYNLDSTKLPNGAHTIQVEIYDGETLAKVKTLTVKVNVNNAGGFTNIQKPNATKTPAVPAPGPETSLLELAAAPLSADLSATQPKSELARIGLNVTPEVASPATRLAVPPAPTPKTLNVSAITRPDTQPIPTNRLNGTTVQPYAPGIAALVSNPNDLATLTDWNGANRPQLARVQLRPRRAGNIAARPGSVGIASAPPAVPMVVAPALARTVVAKAPVAYAGLRRVRKGAFEVKFDNTTIPFDVPTRVAKGVPLAPFRQIFEHTGGHVEWYERTKTVRAVSKDIEIQFRIGNKRAKVNNQMVKMDAKPTMEDGRAVVPLSFIKEALNVHVMYDPEQGRLVIESKN